MFGRKSGGTEGECSGSSAVIDVYLISITNKKGIGALKPEVDAGPQIYSDE